MAAGTSKLEKSVRTITEATMGESARKGHELTTTQIPPELTFVSYNVGPYEGGLVLYMHDMPIDFRLMGSIPRICRSDLQQS